MKTAIKRQLRFLQRLTSLDPRAVGDVRYFPRFWRELKEFRRQGGTVEKLWPILGDYHDSSGSASGHYFHQDLLIAQFIHAANPETHLDVASRIDGFVAHVATFRPIDVLDIRPLPPTAHENIRFVQADLMQPQPELRERYPSVSCLHALEHFGLGRYTDTIDVNGHRKGFDAIAALVAPGGTFYLSFPVGRARVEFNAHRVFDPLDPIAWGGDRFMLKRFDYVDDAGDLHVQAQPSDAAQLDYGCGIYTLEKAA